MFGAFLLSCDGERVLWRPLFPPCQELVWFAGVSVTMLGERWVSTCVPWAE